jgi:type II secretion system protein E
MVDESKEKSKFGEKLVEHKIVTPEQLEIGLKAQTKNAASLSDTLVKLGFTTEEDILPVVAKQLNIPFVRIKQLKIPPEIVSKIPAKVAHHYKILPIKSVGNTLTVAMSDPMDIHTIDDIKLLLGCTVDPVFAGPRDIEEALKHYYGVGAETVEKMMADEDAIRIEAPDQVVGEDIEKLAEDASIIKFVNQVLLEAYRDRATDIHIEPFEEELRIRYRIDGFMYKVNVPPKIKLFHSAIVSRIKVMGNLNIAEHRLPQDGRIIVKVGDKELDLRVSILPSYYGETVNIRLLTVSSVLMGLKSLGYMDKDLALIENIIKKPHGILLVTGPTGSGKTTSLYACLNKLNTLDRKIITIEDPIEYQLQGINQLQVMPKINFTFAAGLRSMLRHDPDIMMVGEIRDTETADITIRSALTGHFVFSTLHTNDAASAVTRLIDMGVEPYLISSCVECIVAQRLVRVICPDCKTRIDPKIELLKEMGVSALPAGVELYEGKGCEKCKHSGYRGRSGIYEILVINDAIRDLIMQRVPANIIKKKAQAMGMRTLRQDGWQKILAGITTISEVLKVTQEETIVE